MCSSAYILAWCQMHTCFNTKPLINICAVVFLRKRLRRTVATTYPHVDPARLDELLPTKSSLETMRSA